MIANPSFPLPDPPPKFAVWAPNAESSVELVFDGFGKRPMTRRADGSGWWDPPDTRDVPSPCDYGYRIDGKGPFPDPRSPFQPNGVHGLSRVVDRAEFQWSDSSFRPRPLSDAILYELHIGTFSEEGSFPGAIRRLDEIFDLGVTHVSLMPVCEFPGERGWGYDGVNLFAPHHAAGGPDGLRRLIDAVHARGLAVIVDVVYNHLGPDGNYLGKFGPYFTDRFHTPWGAAVNFDGAGSDEVRRFFCDNALMWLRDYHADGLRLDAVHAILDMSAYPFLEQLADEVRALSNALDAPKFLIAESASNDPRLILPKERGGFAIDSQWSDDFHHALRAVLTGESDGYYADYGSIGDLAKAITSAYVIDGRYSPFRGHSYGRPAVDVPGHAFLAYSQTHDQVGNRAVGDRLAASVTTAQLKIAAALVLTSPFVPMIFQGEEWGASTPFPYFTDHEDPELAEAVRKGRRDEFAAFGWNPDKIPDPQARETFASAILRWDERASPPHREILEWYQKLIALRRGEPDLRDGDMSRVRIEFSEEKRWLAVQRGAIAVLVNFSDREQEVVAPGGSPSRSVPPMAAVLVKNSETLLAT